MLKNTTAMSKLSQKPAPTDPSTVTALFLSALSPSHLFCCLSSFSTFSTAQGQLENIPCSSFARPRLSPGPLIKHKPSPRTVSFCLSPCTVTSLHLLSSTLPFFRATSIHQFTCASLFSQLSPGPSSFALFAYLSRWRFDIHSGTVVEVNLYKEPDLLFSSASVNHARRDLSHVHFRRMSRSDSAAPF